jgi:hypothetical protein
MIHKAQVDSNFVVIPNDLAQHRGISFELRGLLLYVLSKPVHWKISAKDLQNEGVIGKNKVYSIIKEGINAGYICKLNKTDQGKFAGVEYEVFPTVQPFPQKPDPVLPEAENRDYIKERGIEKKESYKTAGNDFEIDKSENNLSGDDTHPWDQDAFEIWWRAYPRQLNKKKTKDQYLLALKKTDAAELLRGAESYAKQNRDTDPQYIKRPDNWLRDECWWDTPPAKARYIINGQIVELDPETAKEIGAEPF